MAHSFRNRSLSRRRLLRGTGVGLALPMLDAMRPAVSRGNETKREQETPRRMLGICNNLGVLSEHFFPQDSGRDYTLSPYLQELKNHREKFTVLSGVWHPDVDGGHPADNCFLTAAPHPGSGGFRNTISLDQHIAEQIGHRTRFPSMTWGVNVNKGQRSLSWTGGGVLIPCEEKPSNIYRQMFLQGSQKQVQEQIRRLELGQSIMDAVAGQAKQLRRDLGPRDRDRLDQYTTGVRDLEKRLSMSREWEDRPKPSTDAKSPLDPSDPREYMDKVRLMYQMASLAFQTDSTRLITLMLDSVNSPVIDVDGVDITDGYHNLSHHGKKKEKLRQLEVIDRWHMKLLADLFSDLDEFSEEGSSLLDRSMILYGSNLGDANAHVTTNLPVLFAGGGFRHGQHLAFDKNDNYPLPNLFVSMMQQMGLPFDSFVSSTGTMRGLEPTS